MIRIDGFLAQDEERKSLNAELAEFKKGRGEIEPGAGWRALAKVSPLNRWPKRAQRKIGLKTVRMRTAPSAAQRVTS
jgi:hypothetical protein